MRALMRRRPCSPLVCPLVCLALSAALAPACAPHATTPPPLAHTPAPGPAGLAPAPKASPDAAPKWDVNDPPGAETDVAIDVREGTWMSLDVSPDGAEIVFDLLGDLYTVPIGGGEARALTSGMAWDMQPRYSPSGQWIAFTSDRGGGDNVWVIPRGVGEARQITKEDFRLVNSPVWSPDGNYIAVRKHFTKHRSLGSGEIWLYHVSGGKGVQMTEKPNDQKDVGEPAFSPDGKHLYYSQDITPGSHFEYNKDPYAGIYAIKRVERDSGRTERLIGGPGGAARPTPSPDGKSLAFIRRVGGVDKAPDATTLFVRDLESGVERPLFAGLDRDMQETWAIHGVYPAIAWTPDSRELVAWAGGKLWRIRADGDPAAKPVEVPFHVAAVRKVAPAVRFPVKVAPPEFEVRALRDVAVAPDGKSVVYQALGHLYVRTLPEGQPKRLTKQSDRFEQSPAFSRDGKSVVFTTWDDQALGSVRVVGIKGGKERIVTQKPGHYVDPQFTPDGKTVVFTKIGGGWTRSPTWSQDRGIYAAPAKGGPATLVTRDGDAPHFGAGSERVFFAVTSEEKGEDKVELASIELDGSDLRTHVKTENGTRLRVSPDGRWIAWTEGFQALVAPFPEAARPIELGPKSEALPVARVSRDAGDYVHWSGDSQRLHWSLGPELYTRELKEAFSFVAGAPAKLPEPAERGTMIGFKQASAAPAGKRAIVGARVITMRADEVIENATILVIDGRIAAIGGPGKVQVPADAEIVHAEGKTVLPGLIDVHAHGSQGEDGITPEQNWLHYAELSYGVTTVHDPSNDTHAIFAASELQKAGLIVAPRIFSTGTILYGAQAPFKAEIAGIEDARTHLRRLKAIGAFSVKSYNQPRREQRQQVLAAARELGMMVVPEGGSLFHHNMTMVVDGHTGVEHALPIGRGYADVMQLWGHTKVGYTPTLGVAYGGLGGELYWYAHTQVWEEARLRRFVPPFAFEPSARRRTMAADNDWNHIRVATLAKQLLDAGVHVQLGAHGQREGLAAHWELWSLVQGGMTPLEALRSGTLAGAQYLGMDGDLGSLEVGKLADLMILDKDPRTDIRVTSQVAMVMIGGRLFDAATMVEIGGAKSKPAPFFFADGRATAGAKAPAHAYCSGHGEG
jgi:imidazolonepropionase-like amidohydrolase/Tol biopolymer transport system component